MKKQLKYLLFSTLFNIAAQQTSRVPTIAVFDFNPKGLSALESQTLTQQFTAEISNTGKAIIVDRQVINEILVDGGIEASECITSECISEVGGILGAQLIMSGVIEKKRNKYTIEIKTFEVATAMRPAVVTSMVDGKVVIRKKFEESSMKAKQSKNITYTGNVDGLITEIKILAWDIMGLAPPESILMKQGEVPEIFLTSQKTRFEALMRSTLFPGLGQFYSERDSWGWIWLSSGVAVGALAYMQYNDYKAAFDDYNKYQNQYMASTNPDIIADLRGKVEDSHNDMVVADDQMQNMLYAAGGIWVVNMLHAVLTGPVQSTELKNKKSVDLVYDPLLKQPQLRFSIALD
tara:strand:+ start:107 stop:1150 length:1044 start_codon:yes stop_codon:yes gene_type:complete